MKRANSMRSAIAFVSSALAVSLLLAAGAFGEDRSYLCNFTSGPRAGQTSDYTGYPSGPLSIGTPCQDGAGSSGVIVQAGREVVSVSAERWTTISPDMVLWSRALERLLIVLIGGLSIYCGYRLFSIVSTDVGELAAKGGSIQIRLLRIGPGVFFAFFGSAIVLFAMSQSMSVTTSDPQTGAEQRFQGAFPTVANTEARRQRIRTLSGLNRLAQTGRTTLLDGDQVVLSEAAQAIQPWLGSLVDAEFGEGAYAEWQRLVDLQQLPGDAFSKALEDPQIRQRFALVDEQMSSP